METRGRSRTSYSTVLILLGLLVAELLILPTRVRGNAEFSVDGLGCDSCGKDCSAVCGSRQFRSCCFNYIKKRSSGPPSNIHNNNNNNNPNPNNNNANSPSSNPGAELLDPSAPLPLSSPSRFSQRKNGGSKIEESQNGNRVDGGSTDDQQEEQDQQSQQQQQQQMFSISFPGDGGGGIISSTSPINSLKIPGSNWNSHVFLVTETEIPDHLIRRYLSPSSSPGSGSRLGFSFPRNNRGSGSGSGRLMRNRLHSTSAASAQSSNLNPNWISISNPNEIDK